MVLFLFFEEDSNTIGTVYSQFYPNFMAQNLFAIRLLNNTKQIVPNGKHDNKPQFLRSP